MKLELVKLPCETKEGCKKKNPSMDYCAEECGKIVQRDADQKVVDELVEENSKLDKDLNDYIDRFERASASWEKEKAKVKALEAKLPTKMEANHALEDSKCRELGCVLCSRFRAKLRAIVEGA